MSNDIKAVSFRLGEDDIQKFREFAESQGLNQAEMFQSLVNNFEMARAKGVITDRAKEIEVFQDTINNLMSMFINSLAVNQTSEERIRETLSLELHTKDKTIADLQEREQYLKVKLENNHKELDKCTTQLHDLLIKASENNKELEQKNGIIESLQEQINTLNAIVTEYKAYKDINKELEEHNASLNREKVEVSHSNTDLKSKIENLENMKDFYQSEVESLKLEVKEMTKEIRGKEKTHKTELKEIEATYEKEIAALNKNHSNELEKVKKELMESFEKQFVDKLEFEKEKLQLELDKARNNAELLQIQYDSLKEKHEEMKKKNDKK